MRARERPAHRLMGPNLVAHHDGCGCDFIRTVRHAPWVSYDMVDGVLRCDRCGTRDSMPTPAVRVNPFDKDGVDVFMDHDAIADELNRFKDKHQDCPEPVKTPTTEAEGPVN